MVIEANRTGRAAVAAGVLMTVGVEAEWLVDPQRDDGSVASTPTFALLVVVSTLGFVLLGVAVRSLGRESVRRTRSVGVGVTLSLVGAGLLALFGALLLVTGIATGSPLEASFIAFALGLLLLSIGQVVWGLSLRRRPPAEGVPGVLLLAGVMAFAAVAIPYDPWHDVSLVAMFLAWSVIGVLLLARPRLQAAS